MTEQDVYDLQTKWGQAIKDISAVYLDGGDFLAEANAAAAALYGYGHESDILFKPTKASEYPFRPTATGALSYFVGGDNVQDGYSEDGGFAHNVGKGWSEVEFENVQIDLVDDMAFAMGHYIFTQATGKGAGEKTRVEFSFGYKRDKEGTPRIFLHHSSMPYSDASPEPLAVTSTVHGAVGSKPITKEDVHQLQATWGQAILDITNAYLDNGEFVKVANDAAANLYGNTHRVSSLVSNF